MTQIPDSVAGRSDERDRRWAAARATAEAPRNLILKHHWSLCLGDGAATHAFRSLFSELTFTHAGTHGDGAHVRYLLFIPTGASPLARRPLIVWLHGFGDGEADTLHHLTMLSRLFFPPPWRRDRYPFFLLSVLAPADAPFWIGNSPDREDLLDVVTMILNQTIHDHPIDTTRVSVVGASRGGTGCWELAMRHPERFSSIAPISSRGGDLSRVGRLVDVSTWAFQSTRDRLPIDAVRRTVRSLRAAGGVAHLTEFDSDDHDAWTPAFDDYGLLGWLLSQQRGRASKYPPGAFPPSLRNKPLEVSAATAFERHLQVTLVAVGAVLSSLLVVRMGMGRRERRRRETAPRERP